MLYYTEKCITREIKKTVITKKSNKRKENKEKVWRI